MQNCGFGWQNHVMDGALTAGNFTVASLPVTNLRIPQGAASLGYRTLIKESGDSAVFTISMQAPVLWRVFSLHRTNLTPEARWQIDVSTDGAAVSSWSGDCNVSLGQCVHVLDSDIMGASATITVWDQPGNWIDIPLAYAGPLWQPERNHSTKSTRDQVPGQDVATSLGGQEFVNARWQQRKVTVEHDSLGDADVAVIDRIIASAAADSNILFIPDPAADAAVLSAVAIYGRMSAGELSNPYGPADRHNQSFTFTERL